MESLVSDVMVKAGSDAELKENATEGHKYGDIVGKFLISDTES
jgi:hypothetical protein